MNGIRYRAYSSVDLDVVLTRMARGLAERLHGHPILLIGVLRRGAPLAAMLHERLRGLMPDHSIERTDLHVKRYGDDLTLLHPDTALGEPVHLADVQFSGRRIVIVDDVLYQGHSVFRVLEWVRKYDPLSVHIAVLVDRMMSRLPIVPDVAGITLQIAPHDVIECSVPPYEREFAIDIWRPNP